MGADGSSGTSRPTTQPTAKCILHTIGREMLKLR